MVHRAPRRLTERGTHEHCGALDPPAPVEQGEPGTREAREQGVDHHAVERARRRDLVEGALRLLHRDRVGLEAVRVALEPGEAVRVRADRALLRHLGTEDRATVRRRRDLGERHERLVPVQA